MKSAEKLLSVREASQFMGVSEPALRQWTDEYKITAFVTPGGHRRYSMSALKKFMRSNRRLISVKDLAFKMEESASGHRHLDKSFMKTTVGYKMNAATQTEFAALGREILTLIIKSISEPTHQEEILNSIRESGAKFGKMTARLDMSLTSSIQAFVQHRELLTRVATDMMKGGEGVHKRVIEAIPVVDRAMDEALVSLALAHQQERKSRLG